MRKNFSVLAVAAAATFAPTAFAQIDCAAVSLTANVSEEDCNAMPGYAVLIEMYDNYSWEAVDALTDDGYELQMVRYIGDETGSPGPNHRTKGPLLLIHGHTRDGTVWITGTSGEVMPGDKTFPAKLYDQGYDVFLANTRGTPQSRTNMDPAIDADDYDNGGAAAFWDFDDTTIGEKDIPAMINAILSTRADDGEPCQKV